MASTPTRTAEDTSWLSSWGRPAASRSWFQMTWKAEPHRTPRAEAQQNRAADSISEARTPSPLPCLPLGLELIGHGHTAGVVLAVEGVLALDHTGVPHVAQVPGGVHQRGEHLIVGHGGELDGGILPAGALVADGAGGDDHVAAFTSSLMPPQVPTRTKVSAPILVSSSMAMTAEGPPMPVEQTETFSPSRVPV